MSLILDALNRSRQDADPVPGLGTQHPVPGVPGSARRYLPWAALLLALLCIGWLLWERGAGEEAVPAADVGAPVAELSRNIGSAVTSVATELKTRADTEAHSPADAAPAAEALQATPAGATAEASPAGPVESVPQAPQPAEAPEPGSAVAQPAEAPDPGSAVAQPAAESLPAEPPVSGPAASTAVENPEVAELYRKQAQAAADVKTVAQPEAQVARSRVADTGAPGSAIEEEPVDIEEMVRLAQAEMEKGAMLSHPAPFLVDLSQQTKNGIPTIYYQRHDYSSKPGQSSVVLNGKTVKAGGSAAAGLKVEEILPDSVVLDYRGTQFRLRALNSWVNL